MGVFSTRHCRLVCARCRSQIGAADYRALPGRLDVASTNGSPLAPERAGRVLQRLDSGLLSRSHSEELRGWLARNAVEVTYEFECPTHGSAWATTADISAAIRSSDPAGERVRIPTVS